jgi:hypothetical protein
MPFSKPSGSSGRSDDSYSHFSHGQPYKIALHLMEIKNRSLEEKAAARFL